MLEQIIRKIQAVHFNEVQIEDSFWSPRLHSHKKVTVPVCLEQCERTGRISNFAKAADLLNGKFEGKYFNDSDVYKILEGVAYSLMNYPDPQLEARADEIINFIAAAQDNDGYICSYFTLEAPDKKWSDMDKHEMFCGGHLIEAAVAYKQVTGKHKLLEVACKLADHIDYIFGPGKRHWVEGHQEIELALVKLFHETQKKNYLHLAYWLIEERGHGYGVGTSWGESNFGSEYCQDHIPSRELSKVSGHAVRAMYLYTAMADIAAASNKQDYMH